MEIPVLLLRTLVSGVEEELEVLLDVLEGDDITIRLPWGAFGLLLNCKDKENDTNLAIFHLASFARESDEVSFTLISSTVFSVTVVGFGWSGGNSSSDAISGEAVPSLPVVLLRFGAEREIEIPGKTSSKEAVLEIVNFFLSFKLWDSCCPDFSASSKFFAGAPLIVR